VVIRPQRWSGRPGETIPVEIRAFEVDGPGEEGTLHWQVGGAGGELPAPGGLVQIPLPAAGQGLARLQARWSIGGGEVASSQVELAYTTPPTPGRPVQVINDEALAETLKGLGYRLVEEGEIGERAVLIARKLTLELQTAVQQGARLLLIAGPDFAGESEVRLFPAGGVVSRAGAPWQGDWATSFSWLKKTGPFAHLPGGPLLEMEYAEIMPEAVLVGLPAWARGERSWAGLAIGWIHKAVSLLAHLPYGQGTVVVTTFKLSPAALAQNVIAQGLLAGLVNLAGGD